MKIKNKLEKFIKNKRNNTTEFDHDKKLSKLAIKNLREYFKEDYEILNELVKLKLISKEYFNSFI